MKMIKLSTPRLSIVALDMENLYQYIYQYGNVQRNLGVNVTMEQQDREIQYVFKQAHYEALIHPEDYLWYTSWEMILKSENVIIGGLCFKGPPDENGDVEIGYGIEEDYWNKGYTTEALKSLIDWMNSNYEVNHILASTEPENIVSHSVLKKIGFELTHESKGLLWWKRKAN